MLTASNTAGKSGASSNHRRKLVTTCSNVLRRSVQAMIDPAQHLRLLVVDDHIVVREGLSSLLSQESDMTVVGQARDGEEAVRLWQQHRPDVTIMDLSMPGIGGVEAIRRIRNNASSASVLVLSTYDGDEDIYSALRAGAKGYLLKSAEPVELFAAIRKAAQGKTTIPADIGEKLADRLSSDRLSDREVQILQLVVRGLSNKSIGVALNISEGTVKTHLKSILNKLDATSRTEAATIAIKRGIVHL